MSQATSGAPPEWSTPNWNGPAARRTCVSWDRRATEDAVFAPGKAIERSLQNLAERRTDIFGVGEDAATEAEIGKKLGDDTEDDLANQREANSWDGHTVSAEGAVRAAMT